MARKKILYDIPAVRIKHGVLTGYHIPWYGSDIKRSRRKKVRVSLCALVCCKKDPIMFCIIRDPPSSIFGGISYGHFYDTC